MRVLAGVAALPFTLYAILVLLGELRSGFDLLGFCLGIGAAVPAALCWWFALRGHLAESRAHMRVVILGGFLVGAVGFVAGFFGPIILTPEANQGPLLGIFVTGPLGFVAGAAAGWIYGRGRRRPVAE